MDIAARGDMTVCSTPFGITDGITREVAPGVTLPGVCSTPFGITDGITGARAPVRRGPSGVLNAFRHH